MQNIVENRVNQQIDYTEGSTKIKKYSEKHKVNIILKFSNEDDQSVLKKIKEISTMPIGV